MILLSWQEYRTGKLLTGEVKKYLIDVLVTMVERHRRARAAVTEEVKNNSCFPNLNYIVDRHHLDY